MAFLSALRRANVHGALDMGLAPGLLPGRVGLDAGRAWYEHHWGAPLPGRAGLATAEILEAASRGYIGGLVLLGADPRRDFPDAQLAVKAMLGARFVVAVDTHLTARRGGPDVVLPAATWAERRGTFTNLEDRITWLSQLVTARGVAWPDWVIASELATRLGVDLGFSSLDDIWAEISRVSPAPSGTSTHEALAGERPGRRGGARRTSGRGAGPAQPAAARPDGGSRDLLRGAAHRGAHRHAPRRGVDRPEADGAGPLRRPRRASTGGPAAPAVAGGPGPEPERPPAAMPAMLGTAGRRRQPPAPRSRPEPGGPAPGDPADPLGWGHPGPVRSRPGRACTRPPGWSCTRRSWPTGDGRRRAGPGRLRTRRPACCRLR